VNPFPVILSSPSGGGKTAITKALLAQRTDVGYSVSCTTRLPRAGEADGKDYYFLGQGEFVSRQERGEFAESAEVHGKMYGTLRREVERVVSGGKHVIMDIDVQGARQFVKAFPHSVLVFILPPSADVLLTRLTARKTEDRASLVRRMESALEELRAVSSYHYVVTNENLERAVAQVSSVIDAESVRRERVAGLDDRVARLMKELEREIGRGR
jgi:guanylate kinase